MRSIRWIVCSLLIVLAGLGAAGSVLALALLLATSSPLAMAQDRRIQRLRGPIMPPGTGHRDIAERRRPKTPGITGQPRLFRQPRIGGRRRFQPMIGAVAEILPCMA